MGADLHQHVRASVYIIKSESNIFFLYPETLKYRWWWLFNVSTRTKQSSVKQVFYSVDVPLWKLIILPTIPWNIIVCDGPSVDNAPLQQRFTRHWATWKLWAVVTRCRQKGQYPQIHCDKPFPPFREEMPRDIPPPSFNISTKILTWFQLGLLQPSYCTVH